MAVDPCPCRTPAWRCAIRRFARDENGAISSLYAVGILVLVAIAGIGFDYGRLMTLDSELQNAADQAALAAATQLDGGSDAMRRARDAATNAFASAASPYVNQTRIANDDDLSGRNLTRLTFQFYDGYGSATESDKLGTELTSDTQGAQAQVVQVTVNARKVFYALTPLVGAFNSGNVIGKAMARLQAATCNVPPLMFCVPTDPGTGSANTSFPTASDIGKGLLLHMNASAADPWAPGNFGFLDIDYATKGNPNQTLGLNTSFTGCSPDVIESQTGFRDAQVDALNSRFDFFSGSVKSNQCDSAGNMCPATNVGKNFVVQEQVVGTGTPAAPPANPGCNKTNIVNNTDWVANAAVKSLPKDNCFLDGTCTVVGTTASGNWNYTSYFGARHSFNASYPSAPTAATFGKSSMNDVHRYDVYKWELANSSTLMKPELVVPDPSPVKVSNSNGNGNGSGGNKWQFTNYCAYPNPVMAPPGVAPSSTQKDRRVLTVAAVDCTGLHGSQAVRILRWVDLFLVQPADITGSDKSFFTEIIGPAKQPNGNSGFQYYGKRKAVLIR